MGYKFKRLFPKLDTDSFCVFMREPRFLLRPTIIYITYIQALNMVAAVFFACGFFCSCSCSYICKHVASCARLGCDVAPHPAFPYKPCTCTLPNVAWCKSLRGHTPMFIASPAIHFNSASPPCATKKQTGSPTVVVGSTWAGKFKTE